MTKSSLVSWILTARSCKDTFEEIRPRCLQSSRLRLFSVLGGSSLVKDTITDVSENVGKWYRDGDHDFCVDHKYNIVKKKKGQPYHSFFLSLIPVS